MSKDFKDDAAVLDRLFEVIESRREANPKDSRTAKLFQQGVTKVSQKVGEEATETVVAALVESDERLVSECADLIYHLMVLLAIRGVRPEAVYAELGARAREAR
ncbi:MAG: phosphoribosyl-ATP diphosphatase [Alphaproteobacteria bacterium]|nr:phosphoribosyl-ATP diphosphatase [Alphaproteobacteria bacterium]